VTVHRTPQGLLLASRFTWVKASCLCLYPDLVVEQPVVPVAWTRVSVRPAAAPAVPAAAVAVAPEAAVACVVAAAAAYAVAVAVASWAAVAIAAVAACVVAAAAEPAAATAVPYVEGPLEAAPVCSGAVKLAPLYAVPARHVASSVTSEAA
jgi:hypothetical protein